MRRTMNQFGKVITMTGRRNRTGYRAVNLVEAYWHALRGRSGVPRRSEIDPRGIEDALEYAFILEKIAPGLARLRIAGMHLSELMGVEVRGMPISAFIPPAKRAGFSEMLDEVMNAPAIARIDLRGEEGLGRPALRGQMILLPLTNDFAEVTRVLGCLETHGPVGRAPRRFEITGSDLRPLGPSGAWAAREDRPAPASREQSFQEPPARFTGAPAKTRARPDYLRLIKSDDDV